MQTHPSVTGLLSSAWSVQEEDTRYLFLPAAAAEKPGKDGSESLHIFL